MLVHVHQPTNQPISEIKSNTTSLQQQDGQGQEHQDGQQDLLEQDGQGQEHQDQEGQDQEHQDKED